ncbi:T9SS type A sorting domain-containing protein, partial [Candidatus Pacearchaeota archaeon]|nr:T9SS type A sorting domain-containing protein [Candidatus Pacearchaeota archaeon]
ITVSPSINTQYCVTVTDANGCTDQTCATVNVTPSVTPSVLISASSINICSGDQVIFTATPTNGGSSPSYQWKLNGGNVGTNSSTYSNSSLSNGDQVYCIMTSNANCANPTTATSNTITISVNPLPVAQFSASNTNIDAGVCINYNDLSSGNPTSWSWTFSGAAPNSSTLKNPTNICYNTAGTYQVSLTATNSCGSDTESKLSYIDVSTGINELKTNSIKIFPNPVKEKLIVQFENSQKGKFILLNIFGQEIYNQQISGEKIEIGLSEFSEGIYFLIVETEKRIFREKIFVVR